MISKKSNTENRSSKGISKGGKEAFGHARREETEDGKHEKTDYGEEGKQEKKEKKVIFSLFR